MRNPPRPRDSFVIQVRGGGGGGCRNSNNNISVEGHQYQDQSGVSSSAYLNLSAMKLLNRFRKIIVRLLFSFPSSSSSSSSSSSHRRGKSNSMSAANNMGSNSKQKNNCEKFDPPKTSCSSYYSSHSHYSEAIADCIEFLNKSNSQEDGMFLDGRSSSDHVWV